MRSNEVPASSGAVPSSAGGSALDAYLDGELELCLRLLEAGTPTIAGGQRDAMLLRARALLRLNREREVVETLGPVLPAFRGIDEISTANMLYAVAVSRTVSLERGIGLLEETAAAAAAQFAHRTIRAELAYWLAAAHWRKGDHDAVLRYALEAESADADVISVRATSLRGYVAAARGMFPEALGYFGLARRAYEACRERDRNLLERIVVQIASLEVLLRSAKLKG